MLPAEALIMTLTENAFAEDVPVGRDQTELEMLRQLGCEVAQGFWICRLGPAIRSQTGLQLVWEPDVVQAWMW